MGKGLGEIFDDSDWTYGDCLNPVAGRQRICAATTPCPASSTPPVDFSKVEIKTTDLGDNVYMLEGQGGNITVAVGKTGIIMVDGQFAPLHDKIKAAIYEHLQPADQISDQHALSRRPHRRE